MFLCWKRIREELEFFFVIDKHIDKLETEVKKNRSFI